jgi:ubiquitin fusion degradation protein 1
METLLLDPGDLVQIKSTDLPQGSFLKLQPQSTSFLDISDPKAVLENALRNFSALTKGDVFSFHYNDTVYDVAVLEVKPAGSKNAISVVETDVQVDFAPPVGYVEPSRSSGTSTPRSGVVGGAGGLPAGGLLHSHGTMAQAINYSSIAPSATSAATGARAVSSNFLLGGQRLSSKKNAKPISPKPSTPVAGASSNPNSPQVPARRTNGPQPLRLPPNKLFFGYDIKPVKKVGEEGKENMEKPHFQGIGQSLRKRKDTPVGSDAESKGKGKDSTKKTGGETVGGRRLKD